MSKPHLLYFLALVLLAICPQRASAQVANTPPRSCHSSDGASWTLLYANPLLSNEFELRGDFYNFTTNFGNFSSLTFAFGTWGDLETSVEAFANESKGVNIAGCFFARIDIPSAPSTLPSGVHYLDGSLPDGHLVQFVSLADPFYSSTALYGAGATGPTLHHAWDWTAFMGHSGGFTSLSGNTLTASEIANLQSQAASNSCSTDPVDDVEKLACLDIITQVEPFSADSSIHPFGALTAPAISSVSTASGTSEGSVSVEGVKEYCLPSSRTRVLGQFGSGFSSLADDGAWLTFILRHELLHSMTAGIDLPHDGTRLGSTFRGPTLTPNFYPSDFWSGLYSGDGYHANFYHEMIEDFVQGAGSTKSAAINPWTTFKDCSVTYEARVQVGRSTPYLGPDLQEIGAYERESVLRLKTWTDFANGRIYSSLQEIQVTENFHVWYQEEPSAGGPFSGKYPKMGLFDGWCCDPFWAGECVQGGTSSDQVVGLHGDLWEPIDCERCSSVPSTEVQRWVSDSSLLYHYNTRLAHPANGDSTTLYSPFTILYLSSVPFGSAHLPSLAPAFEKSEWVCSAKFSRERQEPPKSVCFDESECTNHFTEVSPTKAWWEEVATPAGPSDELEQPGIFIGREDWVNHPLREQLHAEERDYDATSGVPWAGGPNDRYGALVPTQASPGPRDHSTGDLDGFFDTTSAAAWRSFASNHHYDPGGLGEYPDQCYSWNFSPGFPSYDNYYASGDCGAVPSLPTSSIIPSTSSPELNGVIFVNSSSVGPWGGQHVSHGLPHGYTAEYDISLF